jgi:hypothetical protein
MLIVSFIKINGVFAEIFSTLQRFLKLQHLRVEKNFCEQVLHRLIADCGKAVD